MVFVISTEKQFQEFVNLLKYGAKVVISFTEKHWF
jgi:hypothetical protein